MTSEHTTPLEFQEVDVIPLRRAETQWSEGEAIRLGDPDSRILLPVAAVDAVDADADAIEEVEDGVNDNVGERPLRRGAEEEEGGRRRWRRCPHHSTTRPTTVVARIGYHRAVVELKGEGRSRRGGVSRPRGEEDRRQQTEE